MTYGPDDFQRDIPVSRETREALATHLKLLLDWTPRINLVGPGQLDEYWKRHALDSAQLLRLAPEARTWIDLGSGAGFPGLVLACCLKGVEGAMVDLIESNAKKAAFLREAIRATGAPARVRLQRVKQAAAAGGAYDAVTARAFAPLSRILDDAEPFLQSGAIGLFLKGESVESEITEAGSRWALTYQILPSLSDPRGRIIRVDGAERAST
ncbi:MAG: 16S rRNA (guanine(527)-N(7))-methyltransferase RsmG [Pseudomonadota bacterium]